MRETCDFGMADSLRCIDFVHTFIGTTVVVCIDRIA